MNDLKFDDELNQVNEARGQALKASEAKILYSLLHHLKEGPKSETDLLSKLVGRKQIKVTLLRELASLKIVVRSGLGKKNDPYTYSFKPSSRAISEEINSSTASNLCQSDLPLQLSTPVSEAEPNHIDDVPKTSSAFRKYTLPNGDALSLTEEEFEDVVDAIRMLLSQSEVVKP